MDGSTQLRVTHTALILLCLVLVGVVVHMYHTRFPAHATELLVPNRKTKTDIIRLPPATEPFVSVNNEVVYGPKYQSIEVCAFIISACLEWFSVKPVSMKETKAEPAPAPRKSRRGRRR